MDDTTDAAWTELDDAVRELGAALRETNVFVRNIGRRAAPEEEEALALWDTGVVVREIAARTGLSAWQVGQVARRAGRPHRRRGCRRPVDPDARSTVAAQMVIAGEATVGEAALAAGVTRQAVYRKLRMLRPRSPGLVGTRWAPDTRSG